MIEVVRYYKARHVIQSFSQRLDIDYEETYLPVMNTIYVLMYLVNNTRPNIAFSINLLAKCSSPIIRHRKRVQHVLHYLRWIIDMIYFI